MFLLAIRQSHTSHFPCGIEACTNYACSPQRNQHINRHCNNYESTSSHFWGKYFTQHIQSLRECTHRGSSSWTLLRQQVARGSMYFSTQLWDNRFTLTLLRSSLTHNRTHTTLLECCTTIVQLLEQLFSHSRVNVLTLHTLTHIRFRFFLELSNDYCVHQKACKERRGMKEHTNTLSYSYLLTYHTIVSEGSWILWVCETESRFVCVLCCNTRVGRGKNDSKDETLVGRYACCKFVCCVISYYYGCVLSSLNLPFFCFRCFCHLCVQTC